MHVLRMQHACRLAELAFVLASPTALSGSGLSVYAATRELISKVASSHLSQLSCASTATQCSRQHTRHLRPSLDGRQPESAEHAMPITPICGNEPQASEQALSSSNQCSFAGGTAGAPSASCIPSRHPTSSRASIALPMSAVSASAATHAWMPTYSGMTSSFSAWRQLHSSSTNLHEHPPHIHDPDQNLPAEGSPGSTQASGTSVGTQKSASIDPKEAAKFAALAAEWWRHDGPFAPLHAMNPARCQFIRGAACQALRLDVMARQPLLGLQVLDVGCGGGILSESLARMGAQVTGIDISQENVAVARLHAQQDPGVASRASYQCISAEALAASGSRYDIVIASEVIEHVKRPDDFVKTLSLLLKPGAMPSRESLSALNAAAAEAGAPTAAPLIISTINRTPASFALAVVAAEYVLRVVPQGTHSWEKFITPEELALMARAAGMRMVAAAGMELALPAASWRLGQGLGVNYIAMLQCVAAGQGPLDAMAFDATA